MFVTLLAACAGAAVERSGPDIAIAVSANAAAAAASAEADAAAAAASVEAQQPRLDPSCIPENEGRFSTAKNKWVRYGDVCIDRVVVELGAWPDPYFEYFIVSDRCPSVEAFSKFQTPPGFFQTSAARQTAVLKAAIADDLRAFARECGHPIDPAPFVDERFDEFYADFGEGWLFDRPDHQLR